MDLEPGQHIAQTRQVNDLNSLDDRQAGYTNKFKLPKTATNVRAMAHMTLSGNASNVPYQKNECSLYSDTGECFVYNGWAIVTDGGDNYEAVVYDGVIDLYKAIANTTLADLGPEIFDSIDHTKNVSTIVQSWTEDKNYRYIVADYNGKMNPQNIPPLNIPLLQSDYLVPAIQVSYLWDKVMTKYGFGYSGSIFENDDFTNLWMTYPKGVASEDSNVQAFESSAWHKEFHQQFPLLGLKLYTVRFDHENVEIDPQMAWLHSQSHIRVAQAGRYRLEVEGSITGWSANPGLAVYKNTDISITNSYTENPFAGQEIATINLNSFNGTPFTFKRSFELQALDYISVAFTGELIDFDEEATDVTFRLVKVPGNEIDFETALSEFSTTDFLKEIVHRFGLTLFKRKYENHYEFLTLKEQLENAETEDWTDKFAKKLNESYTYSNYAKQNWLRYQYNDKEAGYNDYYIEVGNQNLAETRDAIKSKIYSPEKTQSDLLGRSVNIYKLWDKEVVEDPEEGEDPVEYKALDKRFYFLKSVLVNDNIRVVSHSAQESANAYFYYAESFSGLPFQDVVNNYYLPLQTILNKTLIVNAEFYLKDSDIVNFDFKKLYYVAQLSGYFLVNKISNYIPGKLTKCELVRVSHTPPQTVPVQQPVQIVHNITIGEVTRLSANTYSIRFNTSFRPQYNLIFQYSADNVNWRTARTASQNWPQTIATTVPANYFRMYYAASKLYSNIYQLP